MLRLLAPVALLGLIAWPALATTTTKTKMTAKHHAAKPAKKMMAKKTMTTETKAQ